MLAEIYILTLRENNQLDMNRFLGFQKMSLWNAIIFAVVASLSIICKNITTPLQTSNLKSQTVTTWNLTLVRLSDWGNAASQCRGYNGTMSLWPLCVLSLKHNFIFIKALHDFLYLYVFDWHVRTKSFGSCFDLWYCLTFLSFSLFGQRILLQA